MRPAIHPLRACPDSRSKIHFGLKASSTDERAFCSDLRSHTVDGLWRFHTVSGQLGSRIHAHVAGRYTRQLEGLSRQVGGLVLLPQGLHQWLRTVLNLTERPEEIGGNHSEISRGLDL